MITYAALMHRNYHVKCRYKLFTWGSVFSLPSNLACPFSHKVPKGFQKVPKSSRRFQKSSKPALQVPKFEFHPPSKGSPVFQHPMSCLRWMELPRPILLPSSLQEPTSLGTGHHCFIPRQNSAPGLALCEASVRISYVDSYRALETKQRDCRRR